MIRGVAPHLRRPETTRPGYGAREAAPQDTERPPGAVPAGTAIAVFGCLATALFVQGDTASQLARFTAIGFGISLGITGLLDLRLGVRNLIRADMLGLAAFYFLTFFEFLFPQAPFDLLVSPDSARNGINAVMIGAIGLLIGRHLWKPRQRPLRNLLTKEMPPATLQLIFWSSMVVGYLHMVIAVNFDFGEMLNQFMAPRFSQPWSRGKLGDWKALLVELGLLIYLLPPLGGIMLARRERYPVYALYPVLAAVLFTFFYGFSGGTRNVLASYLVTFLIGYAFAAGAKRQKELVTLSIACAVSMFFATQVMLEFRNEGMKNWMNRPPEVAEANVERTLFVDYNLYAICRLTEVFPAHVPYIGWDIPYTAIIRPIPRAIWPDKPEGLTFSIEDAMGVQSMTIAATFVGEAYMSGGFLAVLATGLAFGAIFGWWNYLASVRNSELGILIYASGFFCAVISMRSMLVFTTAMLPTCAAILLAMVAVRQLNNLERLRLRLWKQRTPPKGPRPALPKRA